LLAASKLNFRSPGLFGMSAQRFNMLRTFAHLFAKDNAREMNCEAIAGELLTSGK
jgi:hypothetical protein